MPQIHQKPPVQTPLQEAVGYLKAQSQEKPQPPMDRDELHIRQSKEAHIKETAKLQVVAKVKQSFESLNATSANFMPAATGTLSGWISHRLTPYQGLNKTIGAATGATMGYALHCVGVGSPAGVFTGAVSGFKGSKTFD